MRKRPSLIVAALLVAGVLGCSSGDDGTTTPTPPSGTPGIKVSPTSGLKTTEAGGTAKFTVVLDAEPTADVEIEVSSSNTKEGTVKPTTLTFTAANWKAPQTVTITGVDDTDTDGDVAYKIVTAAAKSADTRYDGMDADDVSVTNTDNESAGITVTPTTGLTTTEAGGKATFTVVLNTKPTADVTIPLSVSDATEGKVSPASLKFTPSNWNAPQTVTVTGVDDNEIDGKQTYKVVTGKATSADARYQDVDADDVEVTNSDNDSAGITVSPKTGLTTTEAGGTDTFTIVLDSAPTADVTIALSSSDDTEGTVSPVSVTFTPTNWKSPQTVTVTGVDDTEADGDQPYNIVTAAAASTDTNYKNLNADDVAVTNTDNESAGITVTPTSGLETTEKGGTATFTVVLKKKPSADVTIPVSSSNTAEGTVSPASLTFTPANWDSPQTVTITGVDDAIVDGDQPYTILLGEATSTDVAYTGMDADDVSVTNTDDETAAVVVEPTSGLTTTEAGGTAEFTVVLNKAPTADVTIPISSDNVAEGTVSPATLTFTASNWNSPQTVTITGVDDAVADGSQPYNIVVGEATSTDTAFQGLDGDDVSVTNTDNDSAGVTVTPTQGLTTTEAGGATTFSVVLNSKPSADVTIPVSSSNTGEGTVSTALLTFTTTNWNAPQVVTVTGVDDAAQDGNKPYTIVLGAASSTDTGYAGVDPTDVEVTNTDNDTAGITVAPLQGLTTTEGGQTATFTIVLNTPPSANVTIALTSSDETEGTVEPATVTFTPSNWSSPQTITVTGVDDALIDGAQTYSIVTAAAVSADPFYDGLNASDVTLSNTDNDSAGFTVTPETGLITTEAGGTATFTVALNSQPKANVTIPVASSNTAEGTVSVASLTFTPDNWNAPQTVTLTGVDDLVADGNQPYTITLGAATSTDADYADKNPPDVTASNTDNDSPGVTLSPSMGLTTTESGGVALFSVVLNSKPTQDVTIPLSSSKPGEGTVAPASVTFTPDNWNAPQWVTITGVDDAAMDGAQPYQILTGPAVSQDNGYKDLDAGDVSVTNIDNDTPGITVGPTAGLTTTEAGGTATFTVVLNSKPVANVVIPISTGDATEGTAAPSSLTFTPANWNAPQTVTITGVNDDVQDGNQPYKIITGNATSADPGYDGMNAVDVVLTNTDNDTAGITVAPVKDLVTTEAGGTATFTVVLNSEPTGDVTIPLTSNNTAEGTVAPASLTFTATNWSAPQTVTITGVNDAVQDGNQPYSIVTGAATSTDAAYNGIDPANVSVTNTDNDSAGITVTPITGLTTTEGGATATFSIVLNSEPTGDVTIGLSSSDTTEGTLSVASLVFTPANWKSPQVVTVTGIDDDVADGNQPYQIVTAAATSADATYNGVDPANVSLSNTDNDSAGFTVEPVSGLITTEAGGTATFRIALNSEPTANVTIAVTSSDLTEGTVSPATLVFTPANWKAFQIVTVTGVNDAVADGNQPYTIVTAPAQSTDPGYENLDPPNVSVTNTDNDSAGITVTNVLGITTTEAGGTGTFMVVLNSEPTANVTIPLTSSDATEGTVAPASLVFTPSNWNAPQTVTVTGVDDAVQDGNRPYTILTGLAVSTDTKYSGLDAANVPATNTDNDTAGVTVTPVTGLVTNEAGGTAEFAIVLNSQPTANVSIAVSSSDLTEGAVSPATVTFTPANWNAPQKVTVTGVDDNVQDGNQQFTVVTAATVSADALYQGIDPANVSVTNNDNDSAGITLKQISTPTTTEAGGTATFSIVLDSQPTADVTIGLTSSDTTEGSLAANSITFTPANWNAPQIITVKGEDDLVQDGNQPYSVITAAATSTDPNYAGLDAANYALTNTDNDSAGVTIVATNPVTTEAGTFATFTVVLNSEPTGDVTIGLSSSDTTEGTINVSSLTFTALNWKAPQTVTVQGVDDFVADGNQPFKVITANATSSDPNYNGMVIDDVGLVNNDNDSAGVIISPTEGITTTENGGVTVITVKLSSQPTGDVTIPFASSDISEGTISATSLTFTAANWNVEQSITVKGEDDAVADGNQLYYLVSGEVTSTDPNYAGLNPANATIVNVDNDTASFTVTPVTGLQTTEAGGTATFTVVLNAQPTADVHVTLTSGDLTEATMLPAGLTFTAVNWNVPQTVTVTGIDDFVADGDQPFTIFLNPATSIDLAYQGVDPADVTGNNKDNE